MPACLLLLAWASVSLADAPTDRDWWSLETLAEPRLPELPAEIRARAETPVDLFILAKHQELGLAMAPEADRRTFIRRLHFDLIGLPPSQEDVEAFVNDPHSEAHARWTDRLLASPQYGERWARHWLDVVHYGDTHGYDKDKPRPHAYPYRDYVIRSFNRDKPYDRFVREQIAGDVLWPNTADGVVATGFIAAGPWDFIGHAEVPESKIDGQIARHLDRDDMVANTMNTFCSLTVQCAQCHDHKRDPVSMDDYYSLQAVFAALDRADRPFDENPEVARQRLALKEKEAALHAEEEILAKQIAEGKNEDLRALEARVAALEQRQAEISETGSPSNGYRELIASRKAFDEGLAAAMGPVLVAERGRLEEKRTQLEQALAELPEPRLVYAGTIHTGTGTFRGTGHDGGKPRPIHVLRRGDVTKPAQLVGPGTVDLIPGARNRFQLPEDHTEGERRAALAEWLVRPDNPLTWRSIVNRLWHYHFGAGLVETPNDFGRLGALPSHPELLDWLACTFRNEGQSMKAFHRLICNSAVYRQSSHGKASFENVDSGNRYLWRMNRRKIEAEPLRDSLLWLAGKLDTTMYGPGFQDFDLEKPEHSPHYQYHQHDPDDPRSHRRAIYRFLVRSQPQPFMNSLDCADPSMSVARRDETMTALQALTLLNNSFVMRMSEHFADRLARENDEIEGRVKQAFHLALSRPPTPDEQKAFSAYVREHGLPAACRLLVNLNEFVFVD